MKTARTGNIDLNQTAGQDPRCNDMAAALFDKGPDKTRRVVDASISASGLKPGKSVGLMMFLV